MGRADNDDLVGTTTVCKAALWHHVISLARVSGFGTFINVIYIVDKHRYTPAMQVLVVENSI